MAVIKIEKLLEFAKDGQKSIQGLSLLLGFPRDEKPARDWFNYLFNKSFSTINILIDEVNNLKYEIDIVRQNTPVAVPPPDEGLPPIVNPVGGWTIEKPPPLHTFSDTGLSYITIVHNSGKKIRGVRLQINQIRASDNYQDTNGGYTTNAVDTDEEGRLFIATLLAHAPGYWPKADYVITAPGIATFSPRYYIWNGQPVDFTGGGGGGNANQTE